MKKIIKKFIFTSLRFLSIKIVAKYNPQIIAITGSVGKTSTRQAIVTVLSSKFNVATNFKNQNNEVGTPAAVIGLPGGGRSIFAWCRLYSRAISLLFTQHKEYPDILVLEMGADHPGDIDYLTSFLPPDIGIVTRIAPAHLEFFGTIERLAKEKMLLAQRVKKDGLVIYNADDKRVSSAAVKLKTKKISIGKKLSADVSGTDSIVSYDKDNKIVRGVSFKITYKGAKLPVLIPDIAGEHVVYTALFATAVALHYNFNMHEIVEELRKLKPPQGRMHIVEGIKHATIIDDTYNSSPVAAEVAIKQLADIPVEDGAVRYAVLGDMLELGAYAEDEHVSLGQTVKKLNIDYLVAVGPLSQHIKVGAIDAGMTKDRVFHFDSSQQAGLFLQKRIKQNDILLIKGSQGVRMEKIVKEIMAHPENAAEQLVRQYAPWV